MHIHVDHYNVTPRVTTDEDNSCIWVRLGPDGCIRMGMTRQEAEVFAKALQAAADDMLLAELKG